MPNSFTYLIWHQDSKFLEIRKIIGCAGKTQKELKKKKIIDFYLPFHFLPLPLFMGPCQAHAHVHALSLS
jgi:hypothetical protein